MQAEWYEKITAPEKVRGRTFYNIVYTSVADILRNSERIRELAEDRSVVVNEILMGSRFYGVLPAFQEVFGYTPITGYVKIESRLKPGSTEARVMYNKLVDGEYMLIGDTVASGATMEAFLEVAQPEELHLITIGAKVGVERIKSFFDGDLYVYYVTSFPTNLNPKNETDMPVNLEWIGEEDRKKLLERTTENILRVQCIIGDFSDSMANEPSFLGEWMGILTQMWKYLDYLEDEESKRIVEERFYGIIEELRKWPVHIEHLYAHALTARQRLKGYERVFKPSEISLSLEKTASSLKDEDWDEFLVFD